MEFHDINWAASFDFKRYLSVVPVEAKVKTIFARDVVAQLQKRDKTLEVPRELVSGKDCSLRAYMTLLNDASKILFPGQHPRSAMRQLGRTVFPTFTESLMGRMVVGVMGSDVVSIIKVANKAAAASITVGEASTVMAAPGEAILHLRDVYLSDTYQIGVFEGMLEATHRRSVRIRINSYDINDVYVQITWQDPP